MKIFYAVQATGNGHISRAMEILPHLEQYGEVDIFLSGANSTLPINAPVKYRSEGVSFFYSNKGGLDYLKTIVEFSPLRVMREVNDLPVEKYDLVINDFECITSLACQKKKISSVNFGHQACFQSDLVPRPEKKDAVYEWLLKNYGKSTEYVGLHFDKYDDFILPPVVKKEIWDAAPVNNGHISVYLPSYSDAQLLKFFSKIKDFDFEVFSKEPCCQLKSQGNITFIPVDNHLFTQSVIGSYAVITSAGFETPSEVLFLKKKLLVIPIKGQYEQACNAAALNLLGVPSIEALNDDFIKFFDSWAFSSFRAKLPHTMATGDIVSQMLDRVLLTV